jgi:hypothetical protein
VAKEAPLSIVVIIANAARELPPKTIRRRVPPREELFAFVFVLSEDDDSDDDEDGEKLVLGRWSSSSSSSSSSGNTFRALLDAKETDDDDDGFDRDAERRRCRRRGGRREDAMVVVLPLVATRIFTSSINRVSLRVRFGFRSRERERGTFARESCDDEKDRLKRSTTLLSLNIRAKAYERRTRYDVFSPRIVRCSLLLDSLLNSVLILLLQTLALMIGL